MYSPRARVDLDLLALLDEQRHLDDQAGLERGRLEAPVRVSPFTPGSVSMIVSTSDAGRSTQIGTPSCIVTCASPPSTRYSDALSHESARHVDLVVGLAGP